MSDVFEFEELFPEELHLVGFAANKHTALVAKSEMTARERKALPDSDFALPETREYPIHDETHAHAALTMLHNASPEDQKRIKAAVHRRYPDIKIKNQKGKNMSKKKLVKKVESLRKDIARLAPNTGAVGSLPTVAAVHQRSFGRLGDPFRVFEDRVAAAQADLEKATAAKSEWAASLAKEELRSAKHQLTAMKMVAAEHARERDPQMIARASRGQGIPLVSNRHQLPDDTGLREV